MLSMYRFGAFAFLSFALAISAGAAQKKFVGFAWEFSRMSITNLVEYVDELDKTPLDGIGVYLNEPAADGTLVSTHNIMRSLWRRDALEPLLPLARELTKHHSMKESFIGTFRAPFRKRIEWNDDAGWGIVASNMTLAAWFAKAGGFRGLSMDPEDYHGALQFLRREEDPPYEEMQRLARQRGREVFAGVFREYPEVRILSFWFLSMDHHYLGSADPARDCRSRNDLWPSFVNGILDVMPSSARIHDGCEHSYQYESSCGHFFSAADAIRRRLPALLDPVHAQKYASQVGVSFGIYLDMFTNPEGSSWYFGPADGSRLRHFERNLEQAAQAVDEYVWFWGEKHCWADWRGKGPSDNRKISSQTWDQAVPGLEDAILAVKDTYAYAQKRVAALKAESAFLPVNKNPGCVSEDGKVPAPYSPWQGKNSRQGKLYADTQCGHGDMSSLAAEGAENGAYSLGAGEGLLAGDRLLISVSMKGRGGSACLYWKRKNKWDWNILSPVQVRFGEPDENGWRIGRALARVPEGAEGAGLILSIRQTPEMKCNFDNVSIYRLDDLNR